jgi:hypothetical protein
MIQRRKIQSGVEGYGHGRRNGEAEGLDGKEGRDAGWRWGSCYLDMQGWRCFRPSMLFTMDSLVLYTLRYIGELLWNKTFPFAIYSQQLLRVRLGRLV